MHVGRPLAIVLTVALLSVILSAAPAFGPWTDAVNLGLPINSSFNETTPFLSKDRNTLYFTSNRPCGEGDAVLDLNIWVSHRSHDGWAEPHCLGMNVDGFEDSAPALSRDEHWMFFTSDRPGGQGGEGANRRDIWLSWRTNVHDANGWNEPVNAGSDINTVFAEAGPSYFANEDGGIPQLFFTSNRDTANGFNIFVADVLGDGRLTNPTPVAELNTPNVEARPSIRHDGLEIFFFRIPAGGLGDIYTATRDSVASAWSAPVRVAEPVSTEFNDQQAAISPDRTSLLFVSNRPGGQGNLDIWMTTRAKRR